MIAAPARMVDPSDLTRAQITALQLVRQFKLTRVAGGWRCPGSKLVNRQMAVTLSAYGLIAVNYDKSRCRHVLGLTGSGVNTLAVADIRREARHG